MVSNGVITTIAGTATAGFSGDGGPAASAQLLAPQGIAVDSTGNVYFVDEARIREISNGVITTLAGGTLGMGFLNPRGIAVDSAGSLYVADPAYSHVVKVANGVVTPLAGNGKQGFSGDNGPATSAELDNPSGVAVDTSGNVYITDSSNSRIRIVSGGTITTLATSSSLSNPIGVAVDSHGNLYVAQSYGLRISEIVSGTVTTLVGGGTSLGDNGAPTSAQLNGPYGVALNLAGDLFIADTGNSSIRKVSGATITTVAGNVTAGFGGDNGPATSAQLRDPRGVAADSTGNLYIADTFNQRIRKVAGGVMATVAGTGAEGCAGGGGLATSAQLALPSGIATDSALNIYIADSGTNLIQKIANNLIATAAGSDPAFDCNSGPNGSPPLSGPSAIAVDKAGNLYIADTLNHLIREVSNGVMTTVAGNGTSGFSGDNGPATSAELNYPGGVAVDSAGNLYVADTQNNRIRKVAGGMITTVAGNGAAGFSGDNGPAASAGLNEPEGIAVDPTGNLYVADTNNNRIRLLTLFTGLAPQQTIAFSAPASVTLLAPPFPLVATASSGLPVMFTSDSPSVCTVSGVYVTVIAAGSCEITATQPGNASYSAATPVTQTFTVNLASQTITFAMPANVTFGVSPFTLAATASSGLPVSFASTTPGVCTVAGTTVTVVAAGGCLITASQAGNSTYSAAPRVTQSFIVNPANQTITFGALNNVTLGVPPFTIVASASSGLPISFYSTYTSVCTVSGNVVTIIATGTCSITAEQPGNTNYTMAPGVAQSFTVNPASATPQTITFAPLSNALLGNSPFAINATASSGLPVSFASTTTAVCTVSGNTVTIVAAGTCSITASQAGNSVYAAATPVTQTFSVLAAILITKTLPLQLITVAPCRIMDTRNADGPLGGPFIAGGTTRAIPIPSSACGIPNSALAYSLNVTVVPRAGALSYLTIWPAGQSQPVVSTLNSLDGSTIANAAVVPAGTSGSINAYATDDTDLIIDINGYFAPPTTNSLQFYPLPPCRVLDTRNPTGTFGGPSLAGGSSRSFPIPSSSCGAPANAAAYAFNVTAVPQGTLAYLTAWPTGQPQPVVSTLNSFDGTILANAAIVPAGTDGAASFYASNTTDLVVDINGYFAPPGTGGLNFYPVTPCRLVDTRNANSALGGPTMAAGTTRAFPLPQGSCLLPTIITNPWALTPSLAYSLNLTVVPQGVLGYLSAWPDGGTQPVVSTLNALKGQIVANAAIVPAGGDGSIDVYVTNTTDVVIDTNGYFAP